MIYYERVRYSPISVVKGDCEGVMKRQQSLSLVLLLLLTVLLVQVFAQADPSTQSPATFASSPVLFLPIVRRPPSVRILLPIIRRADQASFAP